MTIIMSSEILILFGPLDKYFKMNESTINYNKWIQIDWNNYMSILEGICSLKQGKINLGFFF